MPILVNSEAIPDQAIEHEAGRMALLPGLRAIQDEAQRTARARELAEEAIIDRVLIRQIAERDPRPVADSEIDNEVERQIGQRSCRSEISRASMRTMAEQQLRLARTAADLAGPVPEPADAEVEAFYRANSEQFRVPESVCASHIVAHVNDARPEEEARAIIQAAKGALDAGEPFEQVAERFSDCKGAGGKLEPFRRGVMVEEFEKVVFDEVAPGGRSGIFRTPFGFHIAEVHERAPGGSAPLDAVKKDITAYFAARAQGMELHRALQELRRRSVIVRQGGEERDARGAA
jgi:parvulin-like peptidyl-prolyl isomerase